MCLQLVASSLVTLALDDCFPNMLQLAVICKALSMDFTNRKHNEFCELRAFQRPIHTSTKLPTKRLTINLPNVKCAASLFTRQRQLAETLIKASIVFSSPLVRVCVVLCAYGYVNNIRW